MSKPHRIAAGGITFKGNAVLLVRYRNSNNSGTYLVSPGGALEEGEDVIQAIIRETKEETGITVRPIRVTAIEDLLCSQYKMIKVWMVCEFVDGEVQYTQEADQENIIEAAWFTRDQLTQEVVFPHPLMQHEWEGLRSETWQAVCLPSRTAGF